MLSPIMFCGLFVARLSGARGLKELNLTNDHYIDISYTMQEAAYNTSYRGKLSDMSLLFRVDSKNVKLASQDGDNVCGLEIISFGILTTGQH